MGVFSDFSPEVEALSLDEAFLDMTGSEQLFGDLQSIGRRLKDAVREATGGLTASVGLSGTKYVAKVASACLKPDGLTGGAEANHYECCPRVRASSFSCTWTTSDYDP
jgi:DNA polymerase-4